MFFFGLCSFSFSVGAQLPCFRVVFKGLEKGFEGLKRLFGWFQRAVRLHILRSQIQSQNPKVKPLSPLTPKP